MDREDYGTKLLEEKVLFGVMMNLLLSVIFLSLVFYVNQEEEFSKCNKTRLKLLIGPPHVSISKTNTLIGLRENRKRTWSKSIQVYLRLN